MQDFNNLTLCITTLLHYHSPFCFALCRRTLIYNGPILREGYTYIPDHTEKPVYTGQSFNKLNGINVVVIDFKNNLFSTEEL